MAVSIGGTLYPSAEIRFQGQIVNSGGGPFSGAFFLDAMRNGAFLRSISVGIPSLAPGGTLNVDEVISVLGDDQEGDISARAFVQELPSGITKAEQVSGTLGQIVPSAELQLVSWENLTGPFDPGGIYLIGVAFDIVNTSWDDRFFRATYTVTPVGGGTPRVDAAGPIQVAASGGRSAQRLEVILSVADPTGIYNRNLIIADFITLTQYDIELGPNFLFP